MGRLFQEKKKSFDRIIDNFTTTDKTISAFCDRLAALQNELHLAKTTEEFNGVVKKMIDGVKGVHQFLSQLTKGADKEIMSKVMAHIAANPNFENVVTLLNYTETATKAIIAKKELLSLEKALSNLTEEQQVSFLLYIEKLKDLKPIVPLLVNQEKVFKDRLQQVTSHNELDEIENEVQNKNQLLKSALARLLPCQEDGLVAKRIIEFLEINKHLSALVKPFNLHESLMGDILNARARIVFASEMAPALGS